MIVPQYYINCLYNNRIRILYANIDVSVYENAYFSMFIESKSNVCFFVSVLCDIIRSSR